MPDSLMGTPCTDEHHRAGARLPARTCFSKSRSKRPQRRKGDELRPLSLRNGGESNRCPEMLDCLRSVICPLVNTGWRCLRMCFTRRECQVWLFLAPSCRQPDRPSAARKYHPNRSVEIGWPRKWLAACSPRQIKQAPRSVSRRNRFNLRFDAVALGCGPPGLDK